MALKTLFNEVEFLTQYPMVALAISDSTGPVPGYLFGEINAITYVDNGYNCKPLANYLVSRLKNDTPIVCIKVLKLLTYLGKNGHPQIIEEVKLHEVAIKDARSFNGPADDVHGSSFYQTIRKMAKELLDVIFRENREVMDSSSYSELTPLSGYGSEASSKKLTGFGHSMKTEKSVSDVVSDSFSNFVEKLFPSPDKESEPQRMSHLSDALPKYKPIIVEKDQSVEETTALMQSSFKTMCAPKRPQRKVKVHRPGRAGGGWESSSDEEDSKNSPVPEMESCKESTISSESLETDKSSMLDTCDISDECKIVEEFAVNKPLCDIDYADIFSICNRCSALNHEEVLTLLLKKVSDRDDTEELVQLRALILIEYLLFHDVVSLDSLMKIVIPHLKKFLEEKKDVKSSVKIKAMKIQMGVEILNRKVQRKISVSEDIRSHC